MNPGEQLGGGGGVRGLVCVPTDRAHRHAERLRGLGVVLAGPHAQREHVALGAAQAVQGRVDLFQPFGLTVPRSRQASSGPCH